MTIVACYFGPKLGVGVFTEKLLVSLLPLLVANGYRIYLVTNRNVLSHSPMLNVEGVDIIIPSQLERSLSSKLFFLRCFAQTDYVKNAKHVLFLADSVLAKNIYNAISVVHDANEFDIHNKFGLFRTWFRKRMIRNVIDRAAKIIVISDFVKSQLAKHFDAEQYIDRLSLIHNGIDHSSEGSIRSVNSNPYFLIVGRVDPKGKKLYEALKIFEAYRTKYPNFQLKIVGGMNDFCRKDGTVFLEYVTTRPSVEYLGYVPDTELNSLYTNAFATIFYSDFEGFGFPILEAFSHGCPVVTNAANAVNDELTQGYDLKIAESDLDNIESICREIDNIEHVDKQKLKSIARNFSWEKSASQYFELLNDNE